jgi:UDP-N-acetyl-D-galactosamine dehydrogenase
MKEDKISIIGLGYVGLPLAVSFSKKFSVVGYDINKRRIQELEKGIDTTNECSKEQLDQAIGNGIRFTMSQNDIKDSNIYIVTVPTPINQDKTPDINPLISASKVVGENLKKGDIVIYESTVYPGLTEEICAPILEENSDLKFKVDFEIGYSPERINPGDKIHTLENIKKIVSASSETSLKKVSGLYSSIITAGVYECPTIKVAEAAKVIENTQRDLNIAFVNELSMLFDRLSIDTKEVLDAAGTKWNFLNFKPGLVGGHCIGIDPYYLAHKAQSVGFHTELILAGRRTNDGMPKFISNSIIKLMLKKGIEIQKSKALVLGVTFKEDCPDIRNSKVPDLINELIEFGINVEVYDPLADKIELQHHYKLNLNQISSGYDLIVLAVSHKEFVQLNLNDLKKDNDSVIYDVKSVLNKQLVDGRL